MRLENNDWKSAGQRKNEKKRKHVRKPARIPEGKWPSENAVTEDVF